MELELDFSLLNLMVLDDSFARADIVELTDF
jgi:hypothetical protein